MADANKAADQLDRLARMFEGVVEARDAFKQIGPLDQALMERKQAIARLDSEIDDKDQGLKEHKADMEKQRKAARDQIAKAQAQAEEILKIAEDRANGIISATRVEAEAEQKKLADRLTFMQRQHEERVTGLSLQAARAKELFDQHTKALKDIEGQTADAEAKLAAARSRIAELMKA